jgi:asparaginyl-tRNA synthetase
MGARQTPLLSVIRLRETVATGLRDCYREHGVVEVRPPLLVDVTGACENVDTLLTVTGSRHGALPHISARQLPGEPRGYLSQTGQLALETALARCDSCWCHTVSFRDDEPSSRHLREFELVEEEFCVSADTQTLDNSMAALALFDRLLDRIQQVLRAGIEHALVTGVAASMDVGTEHLAAALETDFPRVTYDDALVLANTDRAKGGVAPLTWGEDLTPRDEEAIIRCLSGEHGVLLPTIVTLFPAAIKFFNMKLDPRDQRKVLSADVLMPNAGEAVGAAVREDDYETLQERLVTSPMFRALEARKVATLESFEPYLNLIRQKATPRHAGYGIGLDRLLQFIARTSDIRETSLAYRLAER